MGNLISPFSLSARSGICLLLFSRSLSDLLTSALFLVLSLCFVSLASVVVLLDLDLACSDGVVEYLGIIRDI